MIANSQSLTPVSSSEFDELVAAIGYFEKNPEIAIATSGGADSMALLLLADNWAKSINGRVISLTVNHNLRPEASSEALQVAKWCKKYDIEHHILSWEPDVGNIHGIQESARNARYNLMTEWCNKNNILHLLLAHHMDDQVETMLFRLARGSNLDGLSAMSGQTIVSGVRLIRPFLHINKERLVHTLESSGQEWIEDPSNHNNKYTRVAIRNQLSKLRGKSDIKRRTTYVISKFSKFRSLIDSYLVSQITDAVQIYPEGYAIIDIDKFLNTEPNISAKILGKLICALNGEAHPPRSEKLINLAKLITNKRLNKKYTIGGLLFEMLPNNRIIIYRESKSIGKPAIIRPNVPTLWDNRFILEWLAADSDATASEIRALGSDGLAYIKKNAPHFLKNAPPSRIMRTLPSLWLLEQLVCVPHINYINSNNGDNICGVKIKFSPAKQLAGSSFFVMNMNI